MKYRKGDIVKWSYTSYKLKSLRDGDNGGTTYWCCSRIAIFNGERFVDTYWYGSDNRSFGVDDIGDTHEVKYVANLDELVLQNDYVRYDDLTRYYNREDIVDLNHPNNSRGNLYLRKGAKKDINIIRKSLEEKRDNIEANIKYAKISLSDIQEKIASLDDVDINKIYI